MWSDYVTTISIFSADGIFLGMCAHLSGEFDIIGSRISTLIAYEIGKLAQDNFPYQLIAISIADSHESIQSFTAEQNNQLYKQLVKIVEQHNTAIEMCKRTSKIMWLNVLIHFITSAFCICICCFMTLLSDGVNKMLFANYVAVATTQVLIYSIGGNMLGDASTNIRQSVYNFHWYKCDGKVRQLILMMMNRTQKKTVIEVPFFEVFTICH